MDRSDAAELSRSAALRKNILDGDLVVVDWPDDERSREDAKANGQARLLIVRAGAEPPSNWDALEDWIRVPIDREELEARRVALMRCLLRTRPVTLDEFGLLRRGRDWVALSPQEEQLIKPLLEQLGRVVHRPTLLDAIGGDRADASNQLHSSIRRLRRRVSPLGLELRIVRSVGYVLELDVPHDVDPASRS